LNEKKVRIECQGAAKLPIGKIEPFQGELKSLSSENYDRLKKSILELGFSFALQVWRHKGHYYCIDGHQRDRVLTRMAKEGYEVPPVPVDWVEAAGIQERETIIWVKPNFIMGWGDYRRMHETCFYAARAGESPEFYGDRAQPTAWRIGLNVSNVSEITIDPGLVITDGHGNQLFIQAKVPKAKKLRHFRLQDPKDKLVLHSEQTSQTVWEVARDHGNEHPTQKPVELARRAIENSSRPGGLVLDLFLGSGTTLIGAETTGRTCYGMEMDPKYMDVIVDRWESLTGKNAVKCDQT
jgi:hypothetical protein